MDLRIVDEPLAGNDIMVLNEASRVVALFYREYDAKGGVGEARRRAEIFVAALASSPPGENSI